MAIYGALISVIETTPAMLVGTIDENTGALPTTRPDGSDFQDGDYVQVKPTAVVPFTITGLGQTFTVNNISDSLAISKTEGKWVLNPSKSSATKDITVSTKGTESLSGTSTTQQAINIENVNRLKEVLETATFTLSSNKLNITLTEYNSTELLNEDVDVDATATENNTTHLIDSNAVWKEILKTSDCYFKIESNTLKLKLVNNNADVKLEYNLDIDTTATQTSTNLLDSNAVWKETIDTTLNKFEISSNVLTLEFKNHNGDTLFTKTLTIDSSATRNSTNLIDSNAVWKETIDTTSSDFSVNTTTNTLDLLVKNKKNDTLISKAVDIDTTAIEDSNHLIYSKAVYNTQLDNDASSFVLDTSTNEDSITLKLLDNSGDEVIKQQILTGSTNGHFVMTDKTQTLTNKTATNFVETGTSNAENIVVSGDLTCDGDTTLDEAVVNTKIEVPDLTASSGQHEATNKLYVDEKDIDSSTSTFTIDYTGAGSDKLNLTLKNKAGTEVLNKDVDFTDKLVLETKTQTLTNKTIEAEDNTLDLFIQLATLPSTAAKKCLYYDTTNQEVKYSLDGGTTWNSMGGDAFERVTTLPTSSIKNQFYLLDTQTILLGRYSVRNKSTMKITKKGVKIDGVLHSNYKIVNNWDDYKRLLKEDPEGELKLYTYKYKNDKVLTTENLDEADGMYYYHPRSTTWIRIDRPNVDDVTLEYDATTEKLQLKDGTTTTGITTTKINTNTLTDSTKTISDASTDEQIPTSKTIYNYALTNKATGTKSLTIIGNSSSSNYAVNIGNSTTASGNYSVTLGNGASATALKSTALGASSHAEAENAIQIGDGENLTANTMQVGDYQMLDLTTGKIPYDRLADKYTTMPTATSTLADGKIYQYIGATTTTAPIYTHGSFYECVESSTAGTYEWVVVGGTGVDYLPLTGGTMTGDIVLNDCQIKNQTDDSVSTLLGGSNTSSGYVKAYGKDSAYNGAVEIVGKNDSTTTLKVEEDCVKINTNVVGYTYNTSISNQTRDNLVTNYTKKNRQTIVVNYCMFTAAESPTGSASDYFTAIIFRMSSVISQIVAIDHSDGKIYVSVSNGGVWNDWTSSGGDYLPLAGGTMTGNILSNANVALSGTSTASLVTLSGGTTSSNGAVIKLNGASNNSGQLQLLAQDSSNTKTTTFDSSGNITTSATVIKRDASGSSLTITGSTAVANGGNIKLYDKTNNSGRVDVVATNGTNTATTKFNSGNTIETDSTIISSKYDTLKRNVDDSQTIIYGGSSTDVNYIAIRGKSRSTDAGTIYLNSSNGTNTNTVTLNPDGTTALSTDASDGCYVLKRNNNTGSLRLTGGTSIYDARLNLVGGSASSTAGYFDLRAGQDSSNFMSLGGHPDNTLLWTGKVSGTTYKWSLFNPVALTVTYQNNGSGVFAYMIGKMVIVQFNAAKMDPSEITNPLIIGTLAAPSGYTLNNANQCYTSLIALNWTTTPTVQCLAQVNGSKTIKIYNYTTANYNLYGQLVYFTS